MQRFIFSMLICALLLGSTEFVQAQENTNRNERSFLERLLPFLEERHQEARTQRERADEEPARQEEKRDESEEAEDTPAAEEPVENPAPATTTPTQPPALPPPPAEEPQPLPASSTATATPLISGATINPQSGSAVGLYATEAQMRDRSMLLLTLSAGLFAGGLLLARRPRGPREPLATPTPRHA